MHSYYLYAYRNLLTYNNNKKEVLKNHKINASCVLNTFEISSCIQQSRYTIYQNNGN